MQSMYPMPRANLSCDSRRHVNEQFRLLALDEMPTEQIAVAQMNPQLHFAPNHRRKPLDARQHPSLMPDKYSLKTDGSSASLPRPYSLYTSSTVTSY